MFADRPGAETRKSSFRVRRIAPTPSYAPTMPRRIATVLGHVSEDSYCGALHRAYADAAVAEGHEVRQILLPRLSFDPILREAYRRPMPLEPDLEQAQEAIKWAEHLVFVYPTWWGQQPALLRGFVDRVFLPGWAFKYRENSPWWDRFLSGRSARLIVTMGAPPWYDSLVYRGGSRRAMKKAVLEFCGVRPVKATAIGPVRRSKPEWRERWIGRVAAMGRAAD